QRFPMPIECVQTDNGVEFTKRFSTSGKETLTLFQRTLKELGILQSLEIDIIKTLLKKELYFSFAGDVPIV
ncbi:hypothetical protein LJB54_11735, partial [Faecalicatena fissicatena]|nr:hypothetical protein [Faecalicatena fissicatena]